MKIPKLSILLIIFVTFLGILFAYTFSYSFRWAVQPKIEFVSSKWIAGNEARTIGNGVDPFRHRMVKDLLDRYTLIGMAESEINVLLGGPDNFADNTEYKKYYFLTEVGGFFGIDPIASKSLVIKYDKDNIVSSVEVHTWEKGIGVKVHTH